MPEGQVLATAIIEFVGKDDQYQSMKNSILSDLNSLGSAGGGGASGISSYAKAFADLQQQLTGVFHGSQQAGAGLKDLNDVTDKAGMSTRQTTDLMRIFGLLLFRDIMPGMGTASREVRHVSDSLGEMGGAWLAVGAGAALGALALGHYMAAAAAVISTQVEVNAAVARFDMSEIQRQSDAAAVQLRAVQDAWQRLAVLSEKPLVPLTSTEAIVGQLKDLLATLVSGAVVVKDFGGHAAEQFAIAQEGAHKFYEEFGSVTEQLQLGKVEAEASAAAFGLMAKQAPSFAEMAGALELQNSYLADAAELTVQLKEQQDQQFQAKQTQTILELLSINKLDDAIAANNDLAEQMQTRADQRAAERDQNATKNAENEIRARQQVADAEAKYLQAEGAMTNAVVAGAQQRIAAVLAEGQARLKVAEYQSTFYDKAITGLDTYYEQVKTLTQQDTQLQVQQEQITLDAKLKGEALKAAAMEKGSTAQKTAVMQMVATELDGQNKIAAIQAQGATKVIAINQQIVEAKNQEVTKRLEAELRYQQFMASTGQATEEAVAQANQAIAESDNVAMTQRMQAAQQALSQYKAIEQEKFNFAKQMGQLTLTQELAYYQDVATRAGSTAKEREAAELAADTAIRTSLQQNFKLQEAEGLTTAEDAAQFAEMVAKSYVQGSEKATAAWVDAASKRHAADVAQASAGEALIQKMIQLMQQQGQQAGTITDIENKWANESKAAIAVLEQAASGATVNFAALQHAMDISQQAAQIRQSGGSALDDVNQALNRLKGNFQATGADLSKAASGFYTLGQNAEQASQQADPAFEDLKTKIQSVATTTVALASYWRNLPEIAAPSFQGLVSLAAMSAQGIVSAFTQAAGGIPSAFQTAFNQVPAMFDNLINDLRQKAMAGTSALANTIVQMFTQQMQRLLDDFRNRS